MTATGWKESLSRALKRSSRGPRRSEGEELRAGLALLARAREAVPRNPHALPEQPLDRELLWISPLFRRSRKLYSGMGGEFRAALVSSPRTLGSPTLLEPVIEYSPIERELLWAATDARERRNLEHLLTLRTYCASLFHEQNHRVLWPFLPPPPSGRVATRRFLNLAESLVIALDMGLGDELGPPLAGLFYRIGAIYDPGTTARSSVSRRTYRNYLHAACYATYLNLELYDPRRIPAAIRSLFPGLGELAGRACERALRLDRAFVARTNPAWQKKHGPVVSRRLGRERGGQPALELSDDPLDNRVPYLVAEGWFERMGL